MQKERAVFITCIFICLLIMASCVMNKLKDEKSIITLRQSVDGLPLKISITKGETWSDEKRAGLIIFNVLPQIVIWAEDANGSLIDTLYITGADYKKMRHALKHKEGEKFYRESFPVWASIMDKQGKSLPSKQQPYTDAVTSATPMSSFTIQTKMRDKVTPFVLFVEINKAGDDNSFYTEENNDWVGQPSVIYTKMIDADNRGKTHRMEIAGHGGMLKDQPGVYTDLSTLDSALTQIKYIDVIVE